MTKDLVKRDKIIKSHKKLKPQIKIEFSNTPIQYLNNKNFNTLGEN